MLAILAGTLKSITGVYSLCGLDTFLSKQRLVGYQTKNKSRRPVRLTVSEGRSLTPSGAAQTPVD